jgi:hypothetical protein
VGFTRQPGCAANYQYFGWYSLNPFCVGTAQYTLGTAPTGNGDIFLAPNSQTIAARIVTIPTNNSQWYLTGGVRGLLPAWLQFMYTSGCAYADTMTEGSDSLIYVGTSGNATYFWIDASVA